MDNPLDRPNLTPELCYTAQSLRRFLLVSRSLTDDSLSADLNSIPTVSNSSLGSGIRWSKPDRSKVGSRRRLCREFVENSVFKTWQARDEVLEYCANVAKERKTAPIEMPKKKVDPRLDPYEARDIPTYTKEDQILEWVQSERGVEDIVRDRSWIVICEKCMDFGIEDDTTGNIVGIGQNGNGWRVMFDAWRKNT